MAAVQPVLYYFFEAEKLVVGAVQDNGFKFLHEGLGGIVGGLQEEEDDGVAVDAHVCLFFLAAFGEAIGEVSENLAAVKAVAHKLVGTPYYITGLLGAEPLLTFREERGKMFRRPRDVVVIFHLSPLSERKKRQTFFICRLSIGSTILFTFIK
mgnify:FL=1